MTCTRPLFRTERICACTAQRTARTIRGVSAPSDAIQKPRLRSLIEKMFGLLRGTAAVVVAAVVIVVSILHVRGNGATTGRQSWAEMSSLPTARTGLRLHPHQENTSCTTEGPNQCYGELTEKGYESLLTSMPRHGSSCALTPESVFYDIGSGYGRLAMYVALRANVSRVVGMEVNKCRHRHALHGKKRIQERLAAMPVAGTGQRKLPLGNLDLVEADVLQAGVGRATHLFLSIQCWSAELVKSVIALLPKSPTVRCVIVCASGARDLLDTQSSDDDEGKSSLVTLDRWGDLENALIEAEATWTKRIGGPEALYIGKRSAAAMAKSRAKCHKKHSEKRNIGEQDRLHRCPQSVFRAPSNVDAEF